MKKTKQEDNNELLLRLTGEDNAKSLTNNQLLQILVDRDISNGNDGNFPMVLESPNGTMYLLGVTDDGSLTTQEYTDGE